MVGRQQSMAVAVIVLLQRLVDVAIKVFADASQLS